MKPSRWIFSLGLFSGFALSLVFTHMEARGDGKRNREALKALEAEGGPIFEEVAAVANILSKNPNMGHFNEGSKEFCLLSPDTARYMVHFSQEPERGPEDILLFLDPVPFQKGGLRLERLPPLPKALGKMEPYQWYYYDGSDTEPHHNRRLSPYLVIAYSVKD